MMSKAFSKLHMKIIYSFFRLIRYLNLLFIILTQSLFYFCIVRPAYAKYGSQSPELTINNLILLVTASVLIAAAGYIINDYFDLNIDRLNKPSKIVIDRYINRRWAMFFHSLFSFLGLVLTGVVALNIRNPLLLVANIFCVLLLWFYSTTFKKKFLTGNIIISLLTAWVVFVLFVAEVQWLSGDLLPSSNAAIIAIYKGAVLYSGFAFIVSLIREVVKDSEDELGDRKNGAKTMPIVWGMMPTKVFVSVWVIVLIWSLAAIMVYALMQQWILIFIFIVFLLLKYLLGFISKLSKASSNNQYSAISRDLKWLMLFGILSMILYYYHLG